jgi:hypothetical protein
MKEGRSKDGSFAIVADICSMPGKRNGWEKGLYGKFAFMQLEVKKLRRLAGSDPGRGAVVNEPVMLLDSK